MQPLHLPEQPVPIPCHTTVAGAIPPLLRHSNEIVAMQPHTNSSYLFLVLYVLLYRHFRKVPSHADFPEAV